MHRRHPWTQFDDLLSASLEGAAKAWRSFDPALHVAPRHGFIAGRGAIVDDWRRLNGRRGQRPLLLSDPPDDDEERIIEDAYPSMAAIEWERPLTDRERRLCTALMFDTPRWQIAVDLGVSAGRVTQLVAALREAVAA